MNVKTKNSRFNNSCRILGLIFIAGLILILIILLGYIIGTQIPWFIPVITLLASIIILLIFGSKERFRAWILNKYQLLNNKFFNSCWKIILISISLLLAVIFSSYLNRKLALVSQSRKNITIYSDRLDQLNSESLAVREEAARIISQIFVRCKKPTIFLSGLLKICEDPDPMVRNYCKEPLKSSCFKKNEILALEFVNLIFNRLCTLRKIHCKLPYRTSSKEIVALGLRTRNLLETFRTISQFIKTPKYKYGINTDSAFRHEIIYQTLDI